MSSGARGPRPGGAPRALRVRLGVLLTLSALVALSARLVQLQALDAARYGGQARAERLHTVTLVAPRGAILGSDGQVLAETVAARDLYADPLLVTDPTAEASRLAALLGLPSSAVLAALTEHSQFAYLDRGVSVSLARRVLDAHLAGIGALDTSRRVYPDGRVAANILGFVGVGDTGLYGLEYGEQSLLAGRNGAELVQEDPFGQPIPGTTRVIRPAQPGATLRLTINPDIQWFAQQALAQQVVSTHATGGSVVVMDPQTGALLALASNPDFNPNDPSASPPADWTDRAVSDVYEPGSVMKVVVASAAVNSGVAGPGTVFTIPPVLPVDGTDFTDAWSHGTIHLTLEGIIGMSSNIGAIELSRAVGLSRFDAYLQRFGFGRPTGIDLPGGSAGILAPMAAWSGTQAATIPFGQGIAVTALQMADAYAAVANGGHRVTPHVIAGWTTANGVYHRLVVPRGPRIISEQAARTLWTVFQAPVTSWGTAPSAAIPGYLVAGKTGTANRDAHSRGYSGWTASFIGFAPAQDPKLVVEVVLDNPKTDIYGGGVCAPVFRSVAQFALQTLKIPPGTGPPPVLTP